MKTLLKKFMVFFLSLTLIAGLITIPAVTAKAGFTGSGHTDFENYGEDGGVDLTERQSAIDGLTVNNVNGYKFTMYSNSFEQDCTISISNQAVGGSFSTYLMAWLDYNPGPDFNPMVTKLVITKNDNSKFDLNSIVLAIADLLSETNDIILTGYKNNSPVEGAFLSKQVKSLIYEGGENAAFDVSDNNAFKGIDAAVITLGDSVGANVGILIKSITAQDAQESTNEAPTATQLRIEPNSSGEFLEGTFEYADAEGDESGISLFQWYRADDAQGTNEIAIPDAVEASYLLTEDDYGKYIRFEVTPVALTGTLTGTPVKSEFYGWGIVDSISIKSAPVKTTYMEGETLDLSGLVVTLNKNDGSSEDVAFSEFAEKGISTFPVNGGTLNTETSVVIITYTDLGISVNQQLIITPPVQNHTVIFNYGGVNSITALVKAGESLGSLWPANPVKAGYTFQGWYTKEGGLGSAFTSDTIVNENMTVYAKWKTNTNSNPGNNPGNPGNPGNNPDNNSGSNPINNPDDSDSNQETTKDDTKQITVDVKQGDTDSVASKITIERTKGKDGVKSDKVTYQNDKAMETVKKLKAEGKDTARIVIPDEMDEVADTTISISQDSLKTLFKGGINLQMDTEEAKISLPKESVKAASQKLEDDLYFRLVPVKKDIDKQHVIKQAKIDAVKLSGNNNAVVSMIGNPVTIETNMPSAKIDITLPLAGIEIPDGAAKKAAFMKQLAVYIEHSDGERELVQGKLVEYKEGVYGIRFRITKFSTFTVVKTDAFQKTPAKENKALKAELIKVMVPKKTVIKDTSIIAEVTSDKTFVIVKAKVSSKASFKIYSDKALKRVIKENKVNLKPGVNTVYLKVTAGNGSLSKVYTLKITRKEEVYKSHIRLGLIGSKEYAHSVAQIFKQDYDSANVLVTGKGKYYLVTMDFKNKTEAIKACEDMKRRQYIINYYFN
ncbi:InlB B-repeat-containing protein [Anaerocolumna sp. AGMB13025]|uniref:InlB B-repeat-containing protein n=1 Tax=Anaerocolumna sp. AGMB13025 TaxID=3039116 RepID=UPI00241F023F|nr:InlB B-repeat-containing protein [Anaerocolumna sp. AGMB13025]WFR59012.1 InlB B-repeat-containing protein [Anaerocolumna sp. AGMB13025]